MQNQVPGICVFDENINQCEMGSVPLHISCNPMLLSHIST